MKLPQGWQAQQGTLAKPLDMSGHGLHTGRRVRVRILPAESPIKPAGERHGIVFRRVQRGRELGVLNAGPALRHAQPLCTMLRGTSGVGVRTVEHLLAALLACEIDHAVVELDAEEVPILDGSARPWIDAISACGRAALPGPKRFLRVLKPVSVADDTGASRRETRIEPAGQYEFSVRDDLKGFGDMEWNGALTPGSFAEQISSSRSYGRIKWAVPAIVAGYVTGVPILRGAWPSRTAAIIGNHVIGGLRGEDEFVRHRVLDLVGDLALAGGPLLARVTALRPTHEMNYRVLSALLGTPGACEWVDAHA
jgi:UDP-3-O-[3-hydroxymyristoyl] N-acetylglucosamine deacetylase